MATYFSDHFGADGTSDTAVTRGQKGGPGKVAAPVKVIGAFVVADTADGDLIRFFTLNSGVRLWRLWFAATDSGIAGTINLGLYLSGSAHDGAVVDSELFAADIDLNSAATVLTESMLTATTLTLADRGKYLWQLADAGAATLTTDPFVNYDVCGLMDEGTEVSTTFYLEAWFS